MFRFFRRRMRRTYHLAVAMALACCLVGCISGGTDETPVEPALIPQIAERDLDDIKQEGVLRLITRNNSTCYFFLRGEQFGYEYELARRFAESIGVKLEIVTPASWDEMIPFLNQGRGDIIGANFIATLDRRRQVAVSVPWRKEDLVVVSSKKDGIIADPMLLAGRTIYLRRNSAAVDALDHWRRMLKDTFKIEYLPEDMEEEDILRKVGKGEYDITVVSRHIAELERTHTDNLMVGVEISHQLPITWAVRNNAPKLQEAIDQFIGQFTPTSLYRYIEKKYFEDPNRLRIQRQQTTFTLESGKLSPWDDVIKQYARQYDYDWRFIAAVIYHESHFDPNVESWAGAKGLMQLMPDTANMLRMDCFASDRANIHCGVKFLARLRRSFKHVPEEDRMEFVLAAYNAGLGHVRDAQHLAIDTAHNPLVWNGHIDKMLRRLTHRRYFRKVKHGYTNGPVVISYANDVMSLYRTYSQLLPPNDPEKQNPTVGESQLPPADGSTSKLDLPLP
jgi:membrane-bound lytic murein transglycosylase F